MRMKGREQGLVELMDDSYKVREQIRLSDLHAYGYTYDYRGDFIVIRRLDGKGKPHTVTPWPVDPWGRANNPPASSNNRLKQRSKIRRVNQIRKGGHARNGG
jgi:hypothetical protein